MIKLYGFPGTRSSRIQWVLEEAKAPYELVMVNLREGAHKSPEHLARHIHGLVPAYEEGSLKLIESAAMSMHIADKFEAAKLAPAVGTDARARYYELITYAISTLDEHVIPMYLHEKVYPAAMKDPKVAERSKPVFAKSAEFLAKELGAGPWLLGETFTAADAVVGYDLALAAQIGLLEGHPTLQAYVGRLVDRPAFKKAMGR